jgi:hypothetical protein
MLSLLPIVALLASDPAPAASSAPRPTPLTEIGHVQALPVCTSIVVHANGAITQTLDNDRTLAIIGLNLRHTDFDALNELQRRNAEESIEKQADVVRMNYHAADLEIKKLREFAAASPDPQRKAELKEFADALGGALDRQRKAAAAVIGAVTIVHGREEAAATQQVMAADNITPPTYQAQQMAVLASNNAALPPGPPAKYNDVYREVATRIAGMSDGILADEGVAADHSIQATSGC